MKVGDLIKFRHIYNGCDLNNATAVYLGEDFIFGDEGAVVENHKVLMIGASKPTIIDRGLFRFIEVVK